VYNISYLVLSHEIFLVSTFTMNSWWYFLYNKHFPWSYVPIPSLKISRKMIVIAKISSWTHLKSADNLTLICITFLINKYKMKNKSPPLLLYAFS
jgi:hypothetical protein